MATTQALYRVEVLTIQTNRTDNYCCFCDRKKAEPMLCLSMEVAGSTCVELVICYDCLENAGFVPDTEFERLRAIIEKAYNDMEYVDREGGAS